MSTTSHIPLSKLQALIKRRLEEALPIPCWVTAEISELKVNYSGHCYMELVEKGGANAIPCAKAQAVVWRSQWGMLSSYFKSETGTDLSPGMNVLMKVSVSYHELYGLSLVVGDIDPLYTLGDLERQRQKTIEQLQKEGVWDMNRSLGIPSIPQRIAVVSSSKAAGFQDFMNELKACGFHFRVELFDAFMQGHAAEDSVVDALGRICERLDDFDAVVIIRGGGSQSDLSAFDSYRLCSHIAQFPLPVVTGIGHDKDQSIADMVAAVSLKTPTAVAGYLAEALANVDAWLEGAHNLIVNTAVDILEDERRTLKDAAYTLSQAVNGLTRSVGTRLDRLRAALSQASSTRTTKGFYTVESLEKTLQNGYKSILAGHNSRLDNMSALVKSRDPRNILSLGFAVVRHNGSAVTDASELIPGEHIEIQLHKGKASAQIEKTEI